MTASPVYRAPMRSRDDAVPDGLAVERALTLGVCGVGGRAEDPARAERAERRRARFAAAPDGAFVWTRDVDGMLWLGRLAGPVRTDPSPEARAVDLVHVRPCVWLDDPVAPHEVPPAVTHTFSRGGRNWQEIHDPDVGAQSAALWDRAPHP